MQAYTSSSKNAVNLELIVSDKFPAWQKEQSKTSQAQMKAQGFCGKIGSHLILTNSKGEASSVIVAVCSLDDMWGIGGITSELARRAIRH